MAGGNEILKRLRSLDVTAEVRKIAKRKEVAFADSNRWRLSEGKGRDGKYLLRYVDDDYFRGDAARAAAYAEWKQSISPNTEKPPQYADFYIRGDFHKSITAHVEGDTVDIYSTSSIEEDVIDKTNDRIFGVSPEEADELLEFSIKPALLKEINKKTGIY